MALNLTTIAYDRPVANYIARLNATGHITNSFFKKQGVTLHHNGGRLTHDQILSVWTYRAASAQFDSDAQGSIAQYANLFAYAWHAGNTRGNQISVGIEMCNSTLAPTWEVADVTWQAAARLAGFLYATDDLIGVRPVRGKNIWCHHDWLATQCFGPYMDSIRTREETAIIDYYNTFKGGRTPVAPTPVKPAPPVVTPKPAPKPTAQWVAGNRVAKALQDRFHSPGRHDGWFDTQNAANRPYFPDAHWTCIRWVPTNQTRRSPGVAAIQNGVGVRADGILGPDTARGIQRWSGLTGPDVDGVMGNVSVAAVCKKLGLS